MYVLNFGMLFVLSFGKKSFIITFNLPLTANPRNPEKGKKKKNICFLQLIKVTETVSPLIFFKKNYNIPNLFTGKVR